MMAFGVDLAESASKALSDGFVHGLPHVILVAIVAVTSYFQQRQIQGRNPNAEIPPQQKMLMRLMPAMFVVFAFVSPSGLVVYFVMSNLYRIGMQHYITRTLYHGEDSLGAQAQRAAVESKKLKEEHGAPDVHAPPGAKGQGRRRRGHRHGARRSRPAAKAAGTGPTARRTARRAPPPAPVPRTGPRRRRSAADGVGRDDRQDGR